MVTVRALLYTEPCFSSTVFAGAGGLDQTVRTVSVVDAPDSVGFLTGGEVILTTGFLFKDDPMDMYQFVQEMIRGKAAGLAIQMGLYVNEIPHTVKELADRHNFTIFSIPSDIGWSHIITRFHDLRIKERKGTLYSMDVITFCNIMEPHKNNPSAFMQQFLSLLGGSAVILENGRQICAVNQGPCWDMLMDHTEQLKSGQRKMECRPVQQGKHWINTKRLADGNHILFVTEEEPADQNMMLSVQAFYNFTLHFMDGE